ncbi:MAG TPA: phosphoribosyltransferase family protein [Candidatus Saccharimonadales bacterium]
MSIIENLFNIFAPHECLICKSEGDLLCSECVGGLRKAPERCYKCSRPSDQFRICQDCCIQSPLFAVWAAVPYEAAARDLLHELKFARAKAAADTAASVLAATCYPLKDVLVAHVPTVPGRIRERGYDQAALIAKGLAARLKVPYLPLLARTGEQRQLGQGREVRKQQMAGAFRSTNTAVVQNKHILVVDDVLTTGSTCEVAARALLDAGAARVSAAVFAVA